MISYCYGKLVSVPSIEKIFSCKFCLIFSSAWKLSTWNTWSCEGEDAMVSSSAFAPATVNASPT